MDIYGFKLALFDNGDPEEFLLFVRNFQITLEASVLLTSSANIKSICMLLYVEALHQLGTLSVELVCTTMTHVNRIILVLGTYFFLLMICQIKSV